MTDRPKISLAQQIEEVERELSYRRDVYPRQVASGKLRQSHAEFHMARMEAVRATLLWLQKNEDAVKHADEVTAAAESLKEENEALRSRIGEMERAAGVPEAVVNGGLSE